jgi:hypothetical protein
MTTKSSMKGDEMETEKDWERSVLLGFRSELFPIVLLTLDWRWRGWVASFS